MVYGIVEQSGGLIRVESAPGEGATFYVYLPVCEAADDLESRTPADRRGTRGQGTILVVEDEPPLRRLVVSVLAAAGHQVLEAVNGYEAIALAEGHEQIDLLLTDVIMPGITGPDVVARLRSHRPELAVLYMSGYDNELIDQKALERTASFLPKPFTPHSLLASVNELIGVAGRLASEERRGRQDREAGRVHPPTCDTRRVQQCRIRNRALGDSGVAAAAAAGFGERRLQHFAGVDAAIGRGGEQHRGRILQSRHEDALRIAR